MKKKILLLSLAFVLVSCEKEVFIGVVESIPTSFGKIFVSSNPQGYRVYIDDKNMGVISPDTVLWLSEGNHRLSLKHDLFSDSNMTISVKKTQVQSFVIDMLKNPRFYANIICNSNPAGASIYLNDQPTGRITPATLSKVYPGTLEIKFIRSSCRDDSVTMKIRGGQYTEIFRPLNDTTRGVDYRTINTKIASDLLSKVVIDKYNNKWIGSIDHGLMKFDGKIWTAYENSGIFKSGRINDIFIDSKNRMWVATGNGLSSFDGTTWQSYDDKLPSKTVAAIEEDPSGNIWIATTNGLVKYNNSSFQVFTTTNSGIPENNITSIAISKTGEIWFGTVQSGIVSFINNKWTVHNNGSMELDIKISNYIIDLVFDRNETLWVFHKGVQSDGTRNALTKRKNFIWSEFNLPVQFPVDIVSFNVDSENTIWISAVEGFVKYNETKTTKMFNTFDYGFYVKHCTSSCLDKNGDAWITTMGGGLIKLKKANL